MKCAKAALYALAPVNRKFSAGTMGDSEKTLAVSRWQLQQWHAIESSGGVPIFNRRSPHKQCPAQGRGQSVYAALPSTWPRL